MNIKLLIKTNEKEIELIEDDIKDNWKEYRVGYLEGAKATLENQNMELRSIENILKINYFTP